MSRQSRANGYTLNELTGATGVTQRTVRYYISEGLLPPPVAAGPRSYYGDAHLQRLRLIGHMKAAYLPLREIRRRLRELSDDEILDAIDELGVESSTVGESRTHVDALRVLPDLEEPTLDSGAEEAQAPRDHLEPQTWPFVASSPGKYTEPVSQEPAWRLPQPINSAGHEHRNSSVWRKLEIGDSAEFLIEERLYQRRKEQVDALVAWAQRILDGN